jgi:hypothetical protein
MAMSDFDPFLRLIEVKEVTDMKTKTSLKAGGVIIDFQHCARPAPDPTPRPEWRARATPSGLHIYAPMIDSPSSLRTFE